jgi:beta-phosphoglucomutase-like phosphatase (HAD superfamily)
MERAQIVFDMDGVLVPDSERIFSDVLVDVAQISVATYVRSVLLQKVKQKGRFRVLIDAGGFL